MGMQNLTVVILKIPYLIIFLVSTMTVPACIVDDNVRCKHNKNKFGVVVAILPKTNIREKKYFVKWDTSGCSVQVQRKDFIKQHYPENNNKIRLQIEKLPAKQSKFSQGAAILPVILLETNPTFQYHTPPAAILNSVKQKTEEVKHKIEVERLRTENEVPPIKVCVETDIKNETENYYKPANIANALRVVYKQFNCPVYSDYSRGHCYEIV
jgi:hypothetical protein